MSQQKYRELCEKESSIPIFQKAWWLDATCGEQGWGAVITEKNGEISAALPYKISRKAGFVWMNMPSLTSGWGPWIKYPDHQKYKYSSRVSHEHHLTAQLLEKLPAFHYFNQRFRHSISNCLPFYWKGFSLTTRYTYVIEELSDLQRVWDNMNTDIRRDIRKAEKIVQVIETTDIEKFYLLNAQTFDRRKIKMPYSLAYVKKLDEACEQHQCRKIWFAVDEKENIHASLYLVWDNQTAYYLMGHHDSSVNSNAVSLLIWKSIQWTSQVASTFDFEGSMIESIERYFRSFGARQKPYCQVQKINSKLLKMIFSLRS